MINRIFLPLLATLGFGFAILHVVRAQYTPPAPPPPTEPARNPFNKTVAGTGLVEPQTENISIGSPVPGLVEVVKVSVGQKVIAGELLFRLDERALKAEWKYRNELLRVAQAKLGKFQKMPRPEEVPAMEARVKEAEANLLWERDQLERTRRLIVSRAVAEEDLTKREQAFRMADHQLSKVRADLNLLKAGAWNADIAIMQAEMDQAKAQLAQTEMELDRLCVRASLDGEVLQVNVRPGEYVGTPPGKALIVLGDVHHLHLRVDVDEHDIFRFQTSQKACAFVRGNIQQKFELKFFRVEPYVIPKKSLTGDTSERVDTRVLQVIYAIETKQIPTPLFVGQQMDVFVEVAK